MFDELGRTIERHEPSPDGIATGPVFETIYGALGWVLSTTDPLGNETRYTYSNYGKTVTTIQVDPTTGTAGTGPDTIVQKDSFGNVISRTDALGNVTTYEYDDLNRLIKITQPDPTADSVVNPPITEYTYDKLGRVKTIKDPLNNFTEYTYDARGRRTKVTLPNPSTGAATGPEMDYEYDDAGQLVKVTDDLGRQTVNDYDDLGRLISVTAPDPDGVGGVAASVTTYTYDAVGNRLTVTDGLSHTTTYAYDAHNNVVSITDAEAGVTEFTYDDLGNRLTLTDPELNTTSWIYDNLNRVISETNELSKTRYFEYDLAGNLTEKTDRLNRVTEYVYDHLHRLTAEIWKTGGSTIRTLSFTYDDNGRMLTADDPTASYDYQYDPLGRVIEILADIDGLTPIITLTQGFDLAGNRTSLDAEIGATKDFLNTYTYDRLHRQTRVTQEGQSGGNAVAEKRADFAYNSLGQFDEITRYASLTTSEYVVTTAFGYDLANRLTSIGHAQGVTALAGYDYTYDLANRIASIDSLLDGVTEYDHDDTNQLIDADHTGQTDESYTYDANGNRVMLGHTVGSNNQLLSDGTYDYEYDDEGNRTAKETIATGERVEYQRDHRNRLTKVTFKDALGAVTKIVDQAYDANNLWVRSTVDSNGPTSGGVSDRFFVYDGTQVAIEFDNTAASDVSHRYLWGPAVDQLLTDEQVSAVSTAGTVIWPLADHLGTIRDIATYNAGTDTTAVANHRRYDSFGNLVSDTNSAVDLLFGFTGRAYDEASGLQNNWNRWYDSETGQWMSEDPIGFQGRDANLARYVNNHPTQFIDPWGLSATYGVAELSATGYVEYEISGWDMATVYLDWSFTSKCEGGTMVVYPIDAPEVDAWKDSTYTDSAEASIPTVTEVAYEGHKAKLITWTAKVVEEGGTALAWIGGGALAGGGVGGTIGSIFGPVGTGAGFAGGAKLGAEYGAVAWFFDRKFQVEFTGMWIVYADENGDVSIVKSPGLVANVRNDFDDSNIKATVVDKITRRETWG